MKARDWCLWSRKKKKKKTKGLMSRAGSMDVAKNNGKSCIGRIGERCIVVKRRNCQLRGRVRDLRITRGSFKKHRWR